MELRANLVALAGLQGVALCAAGLEEVGALLDVTWDEMSVVFRDGCAWREGGRNVSATRQLVDIRVLVTRVTRVTSDSVHRQLAARCAPIIILVSSIAPNARKEAYQVRNQRPCPL